MYNPIVFPWQDSALLSNGGSLSAWGGGTVSGPGSGTAPSAASVPPGAGGGPPGSGTGTGPGGGNGAPPGGPGAVPTNAVPLGVSPDDMADKHHLLDVGGGIGGGNGGDSDDEKELSAADAEGVWSPDIEQSFQEALAIYPPCGRRKIILSDEGKMYGRNELIARYIKLRTGKTRTRKQVSSHIQVLARRKLRELQAKLKVQFWQPGLQPGTSQDVKPFPQPGGAYGGPGSQQTQPAHAAAASVGAGSLSDVTTAGGGVVVASPVAGAGGGAPPPSVPPWEGRAIATHRLRLVEFSAFMEQQRDTDTYHKHLFVHIGGSATYSDPLLEAVDVRQIYDKFPEKKGGLKELYDKGPQSAFFLVKFWADLNTDVRDEAGAFYGVTSQYESGENMTITCSTKVCSFGKQVVEKVETEYARCENGRYAYRIHRSPMCEYMINFIHRLKHLPEKYMMNSVLENFTILQVVSNRDTQETLLCTAYVFEVSTSEHGAQHHIYRLVKD
ncbi:transcriptional enhancer factor TEF-1 [Ctenocephalides felis]|uniref:transcriptional enhancer factor TEF-1 n=1 Tax=Ctenocephalides felis TaxID=7515 RepID=UPI000E6E12DE|nr:transcriptional enhancer factor TEF-1 [Ctenocephalides felis]